MLDQILKGEKMTSHFSSVLEPTPDRIVSQSEARANGWSQAQWIQQKKYNEAIAQKPRQIRQAMRIEPSVPAQRQVDAIAGNQIAASEKRPVAVGDIYDWPDGGRYEIVPSYEDESFGMKTLSVRNGGTAKIGEIYSNSIVWIQKLIDSGEAKLVAFAPVGQTVKLKPEAAYVQPIKVEPKPLPFKRHPDCKMTGSHLKPEMCVGCEMKIANETGFGDDCIVVAGTRPKTGPQKPGNNGLGSAVFGSWNGRP